MLFPLLSCTVHTSLDMCARGVWCVCGRAGGGDDVLGGLVPPAGVPGGKARRRSFLALVAGAGVGGPAPGELPVGPPGTVLIARGLRVR